MTNNLLEHVIKGFISFVCFVLLTVALLGCWASASLLRFESIKHDVESDFYAALYSEIRDELELQTMSSGIPAELVCAPLTYSDVEKQFDNSLSAVFDGEHYDITLDYLSDDFTEIFRKYAEDNNLEYDDSDLNMLVNNCVSTAESSIKIPYSNTVANYVRPIKQYLVFAIGGAILLLLGLCYFLFRMSSPRAESMIYIGRAFVASGLLGLCCAIFVNSRVTEESIGIASAAYKLACMNLIGANCHRLEIFFGVALLCGAALVVRGVILSRTPDDAVE